MESDFSEVLMQVLGLGRITREKFFKIIEMKNAKKLSSQEFLKLLSIIEKQQETAFENPKRLFWLSELLNLLKFSSLKERSALARAQRWTVNSSKNPANSLS